MVLSCLLRRLPAIDHPELLRAIKTCRAASGEHRRGNQVNGAVAVCFIIVSGGVGSSILARADLRYPLNVLIPVCVDLILLP